MANPAIGNITVLTMEGTEPLDPLMRYEEITRRGVDGHAYQEIGKRAPVATVQTMHDADNVANVRSAALALVGTLVTVTLPDGRTVDQVFVKDVGVAGIKKTLKAVGGITAGSWMIRLTWALQANKVS
jgi:hypothetical protein